MSAREEKYLTDNSMTRATAHFTRDNILRCAVTTPIISVPDLFSLHREEKKKKNEKKINRVNTFLNNFFLVTGIISSRY